MIFGTDRPLHRSDHPVDEPFRRIDHFHYYKASGGELHGGISLDTIIYLEEPKKGGLLHLDPPIRSRDFKFSFQSPLPQTLKVDSRFFLVHVRDRGGYPSWSTMRTVR